MSSEFWILGPLVAKVDDQSVDLGSPKQRALLALLLLHPNRVVTSERILEELWGDDALGKENALWVYVSRLRTMFEPNRVERGESSFLLTQDHGYLLNVDPSSIDAVQFEEEAAKGRELVKDDPLAASELLSRALQRWRGSALQDFAYEEFAQAEITRLEELRLTTIEDRIEADLGLGKSGELIGELEAHRQAHPLRERFVAQLMLALYRSGRQADALRTFERFRRHLGEELGIEPSAELRRLEEQVLLQDPRIQPPRERGRAGAIAVDESKLNPFQGLRAFGEDDAPDFFGRERLVADVVRHISEDSRLVALVGPSGSGKSSVVKAGVVPAIRKEAGGADRNWVIAQMVPGAHPFAELEVALLRASLDAPDSLSEQLAAPDTGLLRAGLLVLPDAESRLLLVIDQFEELFTLVESEEVRRRFLTQLLAAIDDPHGRIVVVVTLRSDFYGRPLEYPEFGSRLGASVINMVALLPDELESAARQPTLQAGAAIESALLAALVGDVVGQPGALPLFQFALTELFQRRVDDTLTLSSYEEMGGLLAVITTKAEDLYSGLDEQQAIAAKQLFLRLVTITEGDEWAKRRVPASEILNLGLDVVALQEVIDLYTRHRLLTLDRDHVSGSPTVEVAHEALLSEWDRLRGWIEEGRDDIRRHAALRAAIAEWNDTGQDPDYLLSGGRLAGYEQWAAATHLELSGEERAYLAASVAVGEQFEAAEAERQAAEAKHATAARRRLWALAAALGVIILAGVAALWLLLRPDPPLVTMVTPVWMSGEELRLLNSGLSRAELELGVEVQRLDADLSSSGDLERQYRELTEAGTDLLFIDPNNSGWPWVEPMVADLSETSIAVIDPILPPAGAHSVFFAEEETGYVAGALAALTTQTDVVGFVGGSQRDVPERWRAGFEAGVNAIASDIEIVAVYAVPGALWGDAASIEAAAQTVFEQDADVVLSVTGDGTPVVLEEAWQQSNATGVHRWVIASGSDWTIGVDDRLLAHLLTSAVTTVDVAVFETIKSFTDGQLAPGPRSIGLASEGVGLVASDHVSVADLRRIEELSLDVAGGTVGVPFAAVGELSSPPGTEIAQTITLTWDGETCQSRLESEEYEANTVIRVDLVNDTPEYRVFWFSHSTENLVFSTVVQPMARNTGYLALLPGSIDLNCGVTTRDKTVAEIFAGNVTSATLDVG